jgi:hypothetical protein
LSVLLSPTPTEAFAGAKAKLLIVVVTANLGHIDNTSWFAIKQHRFELARVSSS